MVSSMKKTDFAFPGYYQLQIIYLFAVRLSEMLFECPLVLFDLQCSSFIFLKWSFQLPLSHVSSLCEYKTLAWGLRRLLSEALDITTKISMGINEILSDVQLTKTGDMVEATEQHCWTQWTSSLSSLDWSSSKCLIMATFTTWKCLTSQNLLYSSWRVSEMLPLFFCRLASWLLPQYHTLSSMDTGKPWFCLLRLSIPSHMLKRSRPS